MSAFAAVPEAGTGTLTVKHAAQGETYTIYKVLDATVGEDGAIAYYADDIPEGLDTVLEIVEDFEVGGHNYKRIQKADGVADTALFAALAEWAKTANEVEHKDANSTEVQFTGLEFGYYVVTSSFGGGTAISVTSTDPDAVTYEKNEDVPQPVKAGGGNYSIGDTITYTVTFPGVNFMGVGENSKIVTSYKVSDTLPNFLDDVEITSVTIDGVEKIADLNVDGFDTDKYILIPWAQNEKTDNTGKWTSLYNNGTPVVITYTAKLTKIVNVGTANINEVTVKPNVATPEGGNPEPWSEEWKDQEEVYTFGAALKKVDGADTTKTLAGAKFTIAGVQAEPTADGIYTVTTTTAEAGTETVMEVGQNGYLYIIGLKDFDASHALKVTETEAPAGYNKLVDEVDLTVTELGKKVTKVEGYAKYDEFNNLVEWHETTFTDGTLEAQDLSAITPSALPIANNKGTELPSTGGIGTTLFYIGGSILVLAAVILLITKRRMSSND